MLMIYSAQGGEVLNIDAATTKALPHDALWYDLESPNLAEEQLAEQCLGLNIPTREEMTEIEVTSRLYRKKGNDYMTVMVINQDDGMFNLHPVTFILNDNRLITVRYGETKHFSWLLPRLQEYWHDNNQGKLNAPVIFTGLLELLIDEMADALEGLGGELDQLSRQVFTARTPAQKRQNSTMRFKTILRKIGQQGENTSQARQSLLSVSRLLHFLQGAGEERPGLQERQNQIQNMQRDIDSLSEQAEFLLQKVEFILDATLGMVSIEQNDVMKITSVSSMLFLPPMLIASIYGMNFKLMPELDWQMGYPLAVAGMLTTALLAYRYFRRRGWM